jgi:hypothetical protein
MREVKSRSFYCPKLGKTVTLVEYARSDSGHERICGILSCSDQELCAEKKPEEGEPIFPWGRCPACRERLSQEEASSEEESSGLSDSS